MRDYHRVAQEFLAAAPDFRCVAVVNLGPPQGVVVFAPGCAVEFQFDRWKAASTLDEGRERFIAPCVSRLKAEGVDHTKPVPQIPLQFDGCRMEVHS